MCKISLSFRFRISLSDMTNYKSAFGKVCRIKNRQTFKSMPILNSAYHAVKFEWYDELQIGRLLEVCRIKNRQTFKSMLILNSAYHAVKYAELRIGILLKVCRFVIRHITQTQTETETELLRRHVIKYPPEVRSYWQLAKKKIVEKVWTNLLLHHQKRLRTALKLYKSTSREHIYK